MICLEVYFPEPAHNDKGSIDLWNAWALSFFLEALYKGSSLFNARPFRMVATDTDKTPARIGEGIYEVKDRELTVVAEEGEITGIIMDAWVEMKKRVQPH